MNMKIQKLLTLIGAGVAGTILAVSKVQAASLILSNHNTVNGTFSYDVTLAVGESLSLGEPLAFTNLGGLIGVNSTNNGTLQYSNSFDEVSANLLVTTPVAADSVNPQIFNDAIILTSNNLIGDISYSALSSAGAFSSDTLQGPSTAVPFKISPIAEIMIILGIGTFTYYKQQSRSSTDDLK